MKGSTTDIVCKATDAAYNTQPERASAVWNIRGICNSSWHRVPIFISFPDGPEEGNGHAHTHDDGHGHAHEHQHSH